MEIDVGYFRLMMNFKQKNPVKKSQDQERLNSLWIIDVSLLMYFEFSA